MGIQSIIFKVGDIMIDLITINQIVNKKPKDVITASDWNTVLTMLIEQANKLSEYIVEVDKALKDFIENGSGNVTVDTNVTHFGGRLPEEYVLDTELSATVDNLRTTLMTEINKKAPVPNLTSGRAVITDLAGYPSASAITTDELNSLAGIRGNLVELLNHKITGGNIFIQPLDEAPTPTNPRDVWITWDKTATPPKLIIKVWENTDWISSV